MARQQTDGDSVAISRFARPIRSFARNQLAGAGLLVGAAVVAFIWANSPWGDLYRDILTAEFTVGFEGLSLSKELQLWINEGLMGIFFFVVGLEIKREFLGGELQSPRKAVLPIAAALGGMIVPAAIYVALNFGGEGLSGWAIPMATDIALCLGALALLGDRMPSSLRVFLTALAIIDDIGAIIVIAVFYTADVSVIALALGGVILVASGVANRLGVRSSIFYFVLGTLTWLAFLESGIHATLAAVCMALTIPARTRLVPKTFLQRVDSLTDEFRSASQEADDDKAPLLDEAQHEALDDLNTTVAKTVPPLQHLEHTLAPLVGVVVLPIFALANAGVQVRAGAFGDLGDPVALGIILGLFVGKQVGVFGFSWIAVKTGLARLPEGLSLIHVYGAAILAGIGFTMSLFIGSLAFVDPDLTELSKMSILLASVAAAIYGFIVLRFIAPRLNDESSD